MNNNYLFYYLQSDIMAERIKQTATGTTAQGIKQSVFRKLLLAIPPLPEQAAIAAILESVDAQITTESEKLTTLQNLKKGLMHDLLTGKVRVA
jgi:type I restriction enzyme S subunit